MTGCAIKHKGLQCSKLKSRARHTSQRALPVTQKFSFERANSALLCRCLLVPARGQKPKACRLYWGRGRMRPEPELLQGTYMHWRWHETAIAKRHNEPPGSRTTEHAPDAGSTTLSNTHSDCWSLTPFKRYRSCDAQQRQSRTVFYRTEDSLSSSSSRVVVVDARVRARRREARIAQRVHGAPSSSFRHRDAASKELVAAEATTDARGPKPPMQPRKPVAAPTIPAVESLQRTSAGVSASWY